MPLLANLTGGRGEDMRLGDPGFNIPQQLRLSPYLE